MRLQEITRGVIAGSEGRERRPASDDLARLFVVIVRCDSLPAVFVGKPSDSFASTKHWPSFRGLALPHLGEYSRGGFKLVK